ncbi:Gfo/Idh/MocA family protein [Ureibacillus sinduriensis]|uniref:Oxidoreductase n=1 Tax=Ureibacillus sinduriensis BLB-1 = JCM 15800 TaxID=1384057 RepID=A0A0A3HNK6_9BACL|nr:Gfo/Idh/MocA family oxidoreductase [Ureibacillus sinduriensis]KGR73969.1 oxidoreductase [Ureibacillus sinduriensis BLB-1 = JCM 15800]
MNFAIIGCGFIAKKHAEAIRNIPGANLVAVCDRQPELMLPYIENDSAEAFVEIEELLKVESIDVVNICTPSGSHAAIAELAANSGKHIIVEKPIAMTIEQTIRIIEAANRNNVKLAVVHPNRFRPVAMKLREMIDNNLLGKISHALCIVNWNRGQEYYDQSPWRGTKEHDGGVLMNQAIHNLDLLLWYLGNPIEVMSMEATRLRNIEAEDVSTGIIKFETGVLATVQASTTVYPKNYEESITIFGEKGTVKIGGANALNFEHLALENMNDSEILQIKEAIEKEPWGTPGHQKIIEDMIVAIREDRKPAVTGEDGKKALSLVEAFYKSAKSKKLLKLQ